MIGSEPPRSTATDEPIAAGADASLRRGGTCHGLGVPVGQYYPVPRRRPPAAPDAPTAALRSTLELPSWSSYAPTSGARGAHRLKRVPDERQPGRARPLETGAATKTLATRSRDL
jgi:hypothetical protein